MGARVIAVIGFIVFIAPTAERCEALFFTTARKLHSAEMETGSRRKYPPPVAFSATRPEIIAGVDSARLHRLRRAASKAFGAGGEGRWTPVLVAIPAKLYM